MVVTYCYDSCRKINALLGAPLIGTKCSSLYALRLKRKTTDTTKTNVAIEVCPVAHYFTCRMTLLLLSRLIDESRKSLTEPQS